MIIPGNSVTASFEGYSADDIAVAGQFRITNTGTAGAGAFTIEVTGAQLTRPNGNFTEWNSTKTVTPIKGGLTPLVAIDDTFGITGQANGTVKRGDRIFQWATQITDALIKRFNCFRLCAGFHRTPERQYRRRGIGLWRWRLRQ